MATKMLLTNEEKTNAKALREAGCSSYAAAQAIVEERGSNEKRVVSAAERTAIDHQVRKL